jgi:membrane protein
VTDFFPIIVICPMVLLVASSVNLSLQQQQIVTELLSVQAIGLLEAVFLKLTPYLLISMAFAFMYAFIPHTKVRLSAAIFGGVVGGVLWQSAQWFYIHWQIGAAKYNAIYGSFAQLPLLLMWIYISWLVVLLGSEVSYAWQNLNSFVRQRFFGEATPFERQKIAVLMMTILAKRFHDGRPLPSVEEISDALMAPTSLVSDIFRLLQKAGYTVLTDVAEREVFAPARSLEDVRILDIVRVVNMDADNRVFREFAKKFAFIEDTFRQLGKDSMASAANVTLLECARQFPGLLPGDAARGEAGRSVASS